MQLATNLHAQGNPALLYEQPESESYELEDKVTRTRVYRGLYTLCRATGLLLPKGTIGTGENAGWFVEKASVSREPHRVGKLTVIWRAGAETQPLPPDEFSCDAVELNPALETHPRYASLSAAQVESVRQAVQASSLESSGNAKAVLGELAEELRSKLAQHRDSYYLAGLRYSWTSYWWIMPAMSEGGVIQTPGGPMAGYLPATMQWLREIDTVSGGGNQGYLKLTRSWMGGPAGHWDADLY